MVGEIKSHAFDKRELGRTKNDDGKTGQHSKARRARSSVQRKGFNSLKNYRRSERRMGKGGGEERGGGGKSGGGGGDGGMGEGEEKRGGEEGGIGEGEERGE